MGSSLDEKVESTAQRVFRDFTETLCNLGTTTYKTAKIFCVDWSNKWISSITGIGSILFGCQTMKISIEKIRSAKTTREKVEHVGRFFFGMGWVVNGFFATALQISKHLVKFGINHVAALGGPIGGIIAAGSGLCADLWKLGHLLKEEKLDHAEIKKTLVSMVSNLCMLIAPILILALVANPYTMGIAIVVMGFVATACPLVSFMMNHHRERSALDEVSSSTTSSSGAEPNDEFSIEEQQKCLEEGLPEWKVVKIGGARDAEKSQKISNFLKHKTDELSLDYPDELATRVYGYRREDFKNKYTPGFYDFKTEEWDLNKLKRLILGDVTRSGDFHLNGVQLTEENIEALIFSQIPAEKGWIRNRILSCLSSMHQGAAGMAYMKLAEEEPDSYVAHRGSEQYQVTLDFKIGLWNVDITQEHYFTQVEKKMSSVTKITQEKTQITWKHSK